MYTLFWHPVDTEDWAAQAHQPFTTSQVVAPYIQSGSVYCLDPLIPSMPVPCLHVLSKNQRRISTLSLGLDHSLGVVESSVSQTGAITGPGGPGQAGHGGQCRNDGRGQSTVMRKGSSLAKASTEQGL